MLCEKLKPSCSFNSLLVLILKESNRSWKVKIRTYAAHCRHQTSVKCFMNSMIYLQSAESLLNKENYSRKTGYISIHILSLFVRKRKNQLDSVKIKFHGMVKHGEGKYSECSTPKIPGRNEYVEKIENILFKDDADVGYKAVGICGMGGTGKTKLARDIFDSEKVSRFSKRIWLCLSNIQRNDRDTVKEKILELVKTEAGESTLHEMGIDDSDEPLDILHRILQRESCLVVFDDVWPWHAGILGKKTLSGGLRDGSAVIITSRLPRVARRVARRMGCLNLNLIPLEPPLYHGKICERTLTFGISDGSSIIGFESCVQNIESKLCEGGFKIIGISGMCGTGKTTLAREIFNDKSVSAAFSTKIWVCLSGIKSNETNIGIQILKLVLNELDYNIDELMMVKDGMVELSETIHLLISHEKYLIVFDDVWPWHANFLAAEINSAGGLPRGSGGAVIVTTRLKKVARRIGGESMIDLQPPLLEGGEHCGKIVEDTLGDIDTSKVFDDAKWNKIKYEIRYQSHGLPFAAKILGGIFLEKIRNPKIRNPEDQKLSSSEVLQRITDSEFALNLRTDSEFALNLPCTIRPRIQGNNLWKLFHAYAL